ncbi:MAG: BlaI/MecI/CopY family transcriptional regulator [Peptococcaceae bacterium]
MRGTKKLPEAELEIMLVIWDGQQPVTSEYIMERLDKDWTRPTLLKLLTRLCDRGFLRCDKEGRHNVYSVLVPREDYVQDVSSNFLQKLHHNSLTSLVASLYDGQKVSKADLEELKRFIEEAEEE